VSTQRDIMVPLSNPTWTGYAMHSEHYICSRHKCQESSMGALDDGWYLEGSIDIVGVLYLLDMLREQGKIATSDALSKDVVTG